MISDNLTLVPHLADLPPDVVSDICARAVLRKFDPGQVIYLEGEPGERLYILENGWIRATRMSNEGREQAMMFLRPVEIFGDIAVSDWRHLSVYSDCTGTGRRLGHHRN